MCSTGCSSPGGTGSKVSTNWASCFSAATESTASWCENAPMITIGDL